MCTDFVESKSFFEVRFGGKASIDALVFSKIIEEVVELIKTSANIVDPKCLIRMDIRANKEGSFQALLDLVTKCPLDLLVSASNVANDVLGCFVFFFEIKKFLRGNPPQKIERSKNETKFQRDGENFTAPTKYADAFLNNNLIEKSVININIGLAQSNRDSFEIQTPNKNFWIDSEEYNLMMNSILESPAEQKTIKHSPITVELSLKKPDLLGNSKWEFVFNKIIRAEIEDKTFLEEVRSGKIRNLYAGVRIPCLLQVETKMDENGIPIEESDTYKVLKILGPIIEPILQTNLFEESP